MVKNIYSFSKARKIGLLLLFTLGVLSCENLQKAPVNTENSFNNEKSPRLQSPPFQGFLVKTLRLKSNAIYPNAVSMVSSQTRNSRSNYLAISSWGNPSAPAGKIEAGSIQFLGIEKISPNEIPTPKIGLKFNVQAIYPSGQSPISVGTGDFNKDGIGDFVVVNTNTDSRHRKGSPGDAIIFWGTGEGEFKQSEPLKGDFPFPSGVVVSDFDRNGIEDIAIGSSSDEENGVTIFFMSRNENHYTLSIPTEEISNHSLAIGDLNLDGAIDIVSANYPGIPQPKSNNIGVSVFLNAKDNGNNKGGFTRTFFPFPQYRPFAISVADLTEDGNPDVVILSEEKVVLLRGDGKGGLSEYSGTKIGSVSTAAFNNQGIQIGDLNGDKKMDLVIVENDYKNGKSEIAVLLGDNQGNFITRWNLSEVEGFPSDLEFANPTVSDIDFDGDLDILIPGTSFAFINEYQRIPTLAEKREDSNGSLVLFINNIKKNIQF